MHFDCHKQMQNWVYLGKFGPKKHPIYPKSGVFALIWYSDWSQKHAYRGVEIWLEF